MAITYVAGTTATPGASGGTTAAIDTTGATLLVVSVSYYGVGTAPTVTDSKGNTWTALTMHGGTIPRHQLFYALTPTVGTGHTFTASGSGFYPAIIAQAYAGVGTFQTDTGAVTAGAASLASGSVTPSANGALVVAGMSGQSGTSVTLAPAGFAVTHSPFAAGTSMQGALAWLVQATAAAINPTWTFAGSQEAGATTAVFLPPVGVTVPDVVGLTAAAAGTALGAVGLTTGTVTTAPSPTVAIGLVISQTPAAGSLVAPGSVVDYVVSTGPAGPAPPPVYVIGIGETDVVPLLATFRIQETIDAPDTMIADVFTVGTPFVRFSLGTAVVVTEDAVRIFGGIVTGTRERGLTGPSATDLVVEIQATSYELSAARRVITAAISQGTPAETIGGAFATLVTDYYAEVGVSLHPDQVAGPGLPAATFERVRGDAVNKQLAASVGYLQSIDFENRLRAWAPGDVLAPEAYDETVNPHLLTGDITVDRQLQNGYANRVILVGNPIAIPDHQDHFTGDGVTDTWAITYQVTGPFPYFVDGAVAFGIVVETVSGGTESIGGVEAPPGYLWEYDPIAQTIHRRAGPVAAGVAFYFPYHGQFVPEGMAEDAAEIAIYGLWEHVENVTAVMTDVSAQEYADALLAAKLASKDEIVTLQTHALGFHPGQTMTIVSPSRQLSGDYLISQVDTASDGSLWMRRSITASKSQGNTHDWRRVYQQWAGASAGSSGGGAGSSPSSGAGAGLPILISASSLLGRGSAGAGSVEEITLSNSLIMTGTSLTVRTGIFEYAFNDTLTEPPALGQIRLNTAFPWTTAAKLWLRFISSDDQDLYWGIMIIPTGAMLIIQDKDDHTKYGQFSTTGAPIDKGLYAEIPITHVANGTAITTAQRVFLRAVAT